MESTVAPGDRRQGLLGLVVADVDGERLSFVRSLLRKLAKIISAIPFCIGFLLAAFTARKQALHDLITKAVVLRQGASQLRQGASASWWWGSPSLDHGRLSGADYMMGTAMKDFQAMMSGETPMPAKPPAMAKRRCPSPAAGARGAAPAAPPAGLHPVGLRAA